MVYAQTNAFAWDEGFHLLAAQLILNGKQPYLDFCFPQTPLNAYLVAGFMHWFGQSWRAVHALSAIWVAGAAFLVGDFIRRRFPVVEWRTTAAVVAAVAVATQSQVVFFGTIGQSYGVCLFLIVAAYRLAVAAVERPGLGLPAATGLAAGAAAGCSLLTAPMGPVLLLWIALCNRAGNRWAKAVAFLAGGAVSWLPIVWLYRQGPEQTIFNLFYYQLRYRHKWNGATGQDISALTSWIDSAQGLTLALLAIAGLWLLWRRGDWPVERRREFYLSAALALGMGLELATAHPTFERYFLVVVPFVAIPAIAGFYHVAIRMAGAGGARTAAAVWIAILSLGLAKGVREDSDSYAWKDIEQIARQVANVTPADATLWADELFFFVLRRTPPDGMQFAYAHDIESMPAAQAAKLHIIPADVIHRRAKAGEFRTVAACYDTENTDAVKASELYRQKKEIRDCSVYWDFGGRLPE